MNKICILLLHCHNNHHRKIIKIKNGIKSAIVSEEPNFLPKIFFLILLFASFLKILYKILQKIKSIEHSFLIYSNKTASCYFIILVTITEEKNYNRSRKWKKHRSKKSKRSKIQDRFSTILLPSPIRSFQFSTMIPQGILAEKPAPY